MKQNDILPDEKECKEILLAQEGLSLQSFSTLKYLSDLSPLTKEIISRQPTINIGLIGESSYGKSTLVHAISSNQNSKNKIIEKEKNFRYFGFDNAKLYKCAKCPEPECYQSLGSENKDQVKCPRCDGPMQLIRHIAFVDSPEKDLIMATMLNTSSVLDGALLLISANEEIKNEEQIKEKEKEQIKVNIDEGTNINANNNNQNTNNENTVLKKDNQDNKEKEKITVVENVTLKNIIIVQNKIDMVMRDSTAKNQYPSIKKYVNNSDASNSPIIPISAQLKYNLDILTQYLISLPLPKRDFISPPIFRILNTTDTPSLPEEIQVDFKGGVIFGNLIRGILKLGQVVEIRPGIVMKDQQGETKVLPIYTRIISLQSEKNNLIYIIPGGLTLIGVKIDQLIARGNKLNKKILGLPGKLPEILGKIVVKCHFKRRYISVRRMSSIISLKKSVDYIKEIKKNETLLLNIGTVSVGGVVDKIEGNNNDEITFILRSPICADISEKLAISRKVDQFWRLIGWGEILSGGENISN